MSDTEGSLPLPLTSDFRLARYDALSETAEFIFLILCLSFCWNGLKRTRLGLQSTARRAAEH